MNNKHKINKNKLCNKLSDLHKNEIIVDKKRQNAIINV